MGTDQGPQVGLTERNFDDCANALEAASRSLQTLLDGICDAMPLPQVDEDGWWCMETREVAAVLLTAKTLSTAHACIALWQVAHYQEQFALGRVLNDSWDDVNLLCVPLSESAASPLQQQLIDAFFDRGVLNAVMGGIAIKKPHQAPRDRVASALGSEFSRHDPFTATEVLKKTHAVKSAYVHGSYWTLYELIDFNDHGPWRVRALGSPGQQRMRAMCLVTLIGYMRGAAQALAMVAMRLDHKVAATDARELDGLLAALEAHWKLQIDPQ